MATPERRTATSGSATASRAKPRGARERLARAERPIRRRARQRASRPRRSGRAGSRGEAVADAPDRLEVARSGRFVFDLFAQAPYMYGDGAAVERGLVAPDPAHQLVTREDTTGMASEEPEQLELARRELEHASTFAHFARRGVDFDVTETNAFVWSVVCRGAATQDRAHTRDELSRRERFRDVVVGAELEPDDAVRFLTPCGQHDH